jgi:transcription antitermination factor NusG
MMPEWQAVYVKHNHEKAASRFLTAHGVDHYLPLYAEQTVWANRRRVVVEKPVFPGYLFVRFTPEQRRKVLMAPGVVCLTNENGFGAITAVEIARLRKAVTRGETPRLPRSLESLASSTHGRSQGTTPSVRFF